MPARPRPARSGRSAVPEIAVVVATRDRRDTLLATLDRLVALPARPRVIVVDNASADGTAAAVRARHPEVDVIALPRNLGAAARTAGVRVADAPFVAFADDDSWWEPGALRRAAEHLAGHPRLGLLAARILVGDSGRLDPTCAAMARSPLSSDVPLPGPKVLGFLACGAVVRREAYLAVGGFEGRLGIGGEEDLLAMDLASAGWALAYVEDVVAHHHPQTAARPGRRALVARNDLWSAWLRRPLRVALRVTLAAARDGHGRGFPAALRGLPWIARRRRVVPCHVERDLQRLARAAR
jgi:N-acetylglucosaminyl-diphospho-decaprenol L-rhamnosyltransferase